MFEETQRLLQQRGDDVSKRASNPSEYLLSGLLFCDRCGKRFVGTAAHGRSARYSYYTCFTRQRYGVKSCEAERVPAEELEEAVLRALDNTYARTDLIEKAFARAAEEANAGRSSNDSELASLQAEIKKAEASLDRYLAAFEDGTMPAEQCGERVKTLSDKLKKLRGRQALLSAEQDVISDDEPAFDIASLTGARRAITEALKAGSNNSRKAVLQRLVAEIRISDRKSVKPTFKVPKDAVRIVSSLAVPTGFEPVSPP